MTDDQQVFFFLEEFTSRARPLLHLVPKVLEHHPQLIPPDGSWGGRRAKFSQCFEVFGHDDDPVSLYIVTIKQSLH